MAVERGVEAVRMSRSCPLMPIYTRDIRTIGHCWQVAASFSSSHALTQEDRSIICTARSRNCNWDVQLKVHAGSCTHASWHEMSTCDNAPANFGIMVSRPP